MKRMLVATMVLGLTAAIAPAAITHTVTYVNSYTIGIGTGPIVDVYTVSFDAGAGRLLGALVLEVGITSGTGDDPFQAAWVSGGKTPVTNLTPTLDDANTWLVPPDTSKCYEADSHFLPTGITGWAPSVVVPTEVNDASVYDPAVAEDYKAGVGYLRTSVAVPVENRVQAMDVIQVGVIRGTEVWCSTGSSDDLGAKTEEIFLIPEPATLSLLAVGLLALARRRRA